MIKITSLKRTAHAVVMNLVCVASLAFLAALSFETSGQSILLADIDQGEELYYNEYSAFTEGNDRLYFIAHNKELWTSSKLADGQEHTRLIKKFESLSALTRVGANLYFVADDGLSGSELWRTNGTEAGTMMVKDIRPGATGSTPAYLTNVRGTLYFSANDGKTGKELWKSNGSAAGTVLVKDMMPKGGHGNPVSLTEVNGTVFFSATDGVHGIELWRSDGTAAGTMMLKDIREGSSLNSSPTDLVNVYGTLFFTAIDADAGRELWKSNGTSEGTVQVKDILPGANSSRISNGTAVYRTFYFSATDGVHGQELWKSDGTEAGTVMVRDLTPGQRGSQGTHNFAHRIGNFTNVGGTLFFTAYQNDDYFIWKSNGTAQGTIPLVLATGPGIAQAKPRFTLMNNRIYYFNGTENEYDPLGFYSMNRSGTDHQRILEFAQEDAYNTYYPELALVNNTFYMSGRPDFWYGFKLVKTDGTAGGTTWLDIHISTEGSDPDEFTYFNDKLYFKANHSFYQQHALWMTDGTRAGTSQVADYDEEIEELVLVDDNLYAISRYSFSIYRRNLVTGDSETLVSDFSTEPINFFTHLNGGLVFANRDGELWKSDGTRTGTSVVKDFYDITAMDVVSDKVIFRVLNEDQSEELWRTNGTLAGTVKIKTIHSGPATPSSYNPRVVWGSTLYFIANDGVHGNELWRSDGTTSGTSMVGDLNTKEVGGLAPEFDIRSLQVFEDALYVSAMGDGGAWALYKTDGSASGTEKVHDMNPIVHSVSMPDQLLLFTHEDGGNSRTKLWTTDGTEGGTEVVHALNLLYGIFSHTIVDDVLYFSTMQGGDLWRTDGTACGTFAVDVGSRGASPISVLNGTLIFGSYDPEAGFEPHAYNIAEAPGNPCGDNVMAASFSEQAEGEALSAYPNPFMDNFSVRFEGADDDMAHVRVYTLYGKPVEEVGELRANTDHLIGQSWTPGVYVLQVVRRGEVRRYVVVKE